MRRFVITGLAIANAVAVPARAETDYIGHMEQFAFAAQIANASKSCQHFGYVVNEPAAIAFAQDTIALAIENGMTVSVATSLAQQAVADETERQEYLVEQVTNAQLGDEADAEAAIERFVSYWQDNCASIAADPRARDFFQQPRK